MKPIFKTPVSMQVTVEQYERDLKEPLEKMGYFWGDDFPIDSPAQADYKILQTNYWSDQPYSLGVLNDKNETHIEEYNPELFLAIAAMTEGNEWIVGEWLFYGWNNLNAYFKCTKNDCGWNDYKKGHANRKHSGGAYRKATLEEILNLFSEKETPNCAKGGEAMMHEATHTVTVPNPKSFPRKMIVSDKADFFENYEVEVHSYNPDLEFPFLTEQDYCGSINGYKFAKEVPEEESVKEMTVSEIQEKLGFKIKIVE